LAALRPRRLVREGKKGGDKTGRTRAGIASKRHVIVEGHGLPIGLHLDSGAVADITAAPATLATIRVPRRRGRPRTRPLGLAADKGYDCARFRRALARRGIRHAIPTRHHHGQRRQRGRPPQAPPALWRHRWKVERFFAWLNGFRRLNTRFERYSCMYLAFLTLAAVFICLRRLLQ
jgi:transposase